MKKTEKKLESVETVDVPVPLDGEALAEAAQKLARASRALDQHADEKRQFLASWRETNKAKKEVHDELRDVVQERAAPKRMKAIVVTDFDKKEVRYLDPKTRKVIHTRKLTEADRQQHVPGTMPPKHAGKHVTDKPPAGADGKVQGTVKEPEVGKVSELFPKEA